MSTQTIDFFARQFERQIAAADYALNPFETWILPHLSGRVLDLGCGLGNLSLAAARAGHEVDALDGCAQAVADLARRAQALALPVRVGQADLQHWRAGRCWDSVVSIGLLMFFACDDARQVLGEIRRAVSPGGIAAVNVLIEGTTYMQMFDPGRHCLFEPAELRQTFAGWTLLLDRVDDFPAPDASIKRFATVVARRPAG
ncbi:MAG: class I SAM-dependent methyltransferase [Burkholderiales bacterium]|nr:MAG: class I SAM-dependent methyltransferase [Burkholderiales bacterium]